MNKVPPTGRSELEEAQRLVDAALPYVLKHGYRDLSLRAIAEQLSTSHRMLIYYFGSADGFWEAVLARLRGHRIESLSQQAAEQKVPSLEEVWTQLTTPQQLSWFRLMFQIYGKALGKPDRHQEFLRQVVDVWLDSLTMGLSAEYGWPHEKARLHARLHLAVIRGLMLDLLTTGDLQGTTQALALFARSIEPGKTR